MFRKKRYTVVDNETGEAVGQLSRLPSKSEDIDNYLRVFYKNPLFKAKLRYPVRAVLFCIASRMPYSNAGYAVNISSALKEKIGEECDMSIPTVDRCISTLLGRGYLYRVGRGEYLINPYLFGKGPAAAIQARRDEWDILITPTQENASTGPETASEKKNTPA